jgi:hypothetical protein
MTDQKPNLPGRSTRDVLFDVRTIIAALFGVYGIVCLIWGLAFEGPTDRARSGNINVNVWMGVAMVLFAAGFAAWAVARPLVPPEDRRETEAALGADDEADAERTGEPARR